MNLDEILNDPDKAFEAGWKMPDHEFKHHAEQIAAAVTRDPHNSRCAGLYWNDERFNRFAEPIIATVFWKLQTTFDAGLDWKYERKLRLAEQLVAVAIKEPYLTYDAAIWMSDDMFDKFAPKIMEAITQHPVLCYHAGRYWSDKRFNRCAQQLIEGIKKDPEFVFKAGRNYATCNTTLELRNSMAMPLRDPVDDYNEGWNDERFYAHANQLLSGIPTDSINAKNMRQFWHKRRAIFFDYPELGTYYNNIEPQCRATFLDFAENIGGYLLKVQKTDFYTATEAYAFAKQAHSERPFFKGLGESAQKGTVGKWAKAIIQYFREKSKGAGNYRILEVAA